jgi:hypothetical protein
MSFVTVWRSWRLKVHDILEVGGDAHPAGRIVNGFLVALIIANGIAFTAETVDSVYARWGPQLDAFNTFSVMVFTVEYVLRLWSSVEIPLLHHLPHWRARLKFRDAADDDHRPARHFALVHPRGRAHRSQGAADAAAVPAAQARALLPGVANAETSGGA